MTNVLIVDDAATIRILFERIINESEDYNLAGSLENANAALPYCMRTQVDLVIMDVYTKNRENGLEAAANIKKEFPNIKIIVATSLPEASFLEKAREAGCESFWYKELGEFGLLDIMNRTMKGERVYPDATPEITIGNAKSVEFTPMEMKVLRELCNGKLNKDIAEKVATANPQDEYYVSYLNEKTIIFN